MEARGRRGRRWTYEAFARLPGMEDDGRRREIIAGGLYVTPVARTHHQLVSLQLLRLVGNFVEEHGLGWVFPPVDVLLAEGDYLEPDLVFIRRERRDIISDRGIEAAPDLVVEILSPSTAERDRGIKRERYARYGVPEYWIVDPDARTIERWRFADDADAPEIETDALHWQPMPDGPVLEVPVADVTTGL